MGPMASYVSLNTLIKVNTKTAKTAFIRVLIDLDFTATVDCRIHALFIQAESREKRPSSGSGARACYLKTNYLSI